MTVLVRDAANVQRTISAVVVRDAANVSRTISEIRVRDTMNTSRIVFSTGAALSATPSPTDVFGFDAGSGTATSDSTTVTPAGGTAPYTYAWTVLSYTAGTPPTVSAPTAATTDFIQTGMAPSDYFYAVFRCTVTDALAATATADVNATFYSLGP